MLSPTSAVQSAIVHRATLVLLDLGLPLELVGHGRTEVVANVLMVVPAGLVGVLAFARSRWQDWASYGFLGALAVELVQGFLLPARSASSTDVVANTLGMFVGPVVGVLVRSVVRRRGTRRG